MAKKSDSVSNLKLTSYDDLFETDESREDLKRERLMEIPISEIRDFPDHPYMVKDDEAMLELVESIRTRGLIQPVLVRPVENGQYEMVSGHRRKRAFELANIEKIPARVMELTRDEAILSMVDSNLQRDEILPSEKAKAYKMRLEAIKRQGDRSDLTSRPVGEKLLSVNRVSNDATDSARQIHRYIRLTYLVTPLLDMVDEGKIAFRPAVELSYLTQLEQTDLVETISYEDATPSLAQAIKMRDFSKNGRLSADVILSIMCEKKPNQADKISFRTDRLKQYLPKNITPKQTEEYVLKALEHYQRYQERNNRQHHDR